MKTKEQLVKIVQDNSGYYPKYFAKWVDQNHLICREFIITTLELLSRNHTHWGAHAILHHIRLETALKEQSYQAAILDVKIRNDVFPYIARLFAMAYPSLDFFFKYKATGTVLQFKPSGSQWDEDSLMVASNLLNQYKGL